MRALRRHGAAFGPFLAALAVLVVVSVGSGLLGMVFATVPAEAQHAADQPSNARGPASVSDEWRLVRHGLVGDVAIPNKQAAVLIQSEGQTFREVHNGPLVIFGAFTVIATILVLAVYHLLHGQIRIEGGWSGRVIARFNSLERFAHWLTASAFVVLGLTGLNILYGRYVLRPLIGASAFSALTLWGKYFHNYFAFAFMMGLALMFVVWVRDNIPNRYDLKWLAMGGGMFGKGQKAPARKFNAGQKMLFWVVMLGGLSLCVSGVALLFPFHFAWFSETFKLINLLGVGLPTDLTPLQETQLSQLWHAAVGLVLVGAIIAHVYIGTLGMEGAFDAMNTGNVDANWAEEHHNIWVAEMEKRPSGGSD